MFGHSEAFLMQLCNNYSTDDPEIVVTGDAGTVERPQNVAPP